jgi:methylenetetrahydrofolate reductase (NADPH)
MHAQDLFDRQRTTFSFEFFPPRTPETAEQLYSAIAELESLKPSFVSITYGAGGSTRELTHDLVLRIRNQSSLLPVPHLTCVGHTEAEIRAILERYAAAGISNIVALGGDLPKGMESHDRSRDAFRHAADLVHFIKKFNAEGGHPDPRGFGICVAGYPEGHAATPNRVKEMD